MKHQTSGDSQRFSVEMEIANYQDMRLAQEGLLSSAQVRRTAIPALANTRATRMVLPHQVVADLGLPIHGTIGVSYAGHAAVEREQATDVWVRIQNRDAVVTAIVEPEAADAIVGNRVMTELDLIVDRTNQRLLPRDPQTIIADIG